MPRQRLRRALLIGGLVSALSVSYFAGWITARQVGVSPIDAFFAGAANQSLQRDTPAAAREQFAVFWEVWNLVQSAFYSPQQIDTQQLAYGAISGMLAALGDPHTIFQEPVVAEQSRESMEGRFDGIGAYLRVVDGQVTIDRVIPGAPAALGGLRADDTIIAVDGKLLADELAGLSDNEAVNRAATLIRGPRGTSVVLTIRRQALADFVLTLVRAEVPLISVNSELLPDGVLYLQITDFKATTTGQLDQVIAALEQPPSAVILDLRDNPGGFLTTAREVLGRFYRGLALIEEERDGVVKELDTIVDGAKTTLYGVRTIVLVNRNSASAAEIVAGALLDQVPQTLLIGEKTYGKGSVQNIYPLLDGSSARITIAHWRTPAGNAINGSGITPQLEVAPSDAAEFAVPCLIGRRPPAEQTDCADAQLSRALDAAATPLP
jgi:carboxyl-terminal processing protease